MVIHSYNCNYLKMPFTEFHFGVNSGSSISKITDLHNSTKILIQVLYELVRLISCRQWGAMFSSFLIMAIQTVLN